MRSGLGPMLHLLLVLSFPLPLSVRRAAAVGVNWGSAASHPLPPSKVVSGLLLANGVARVKLPDANPAVLQSLVGSGISVAVGIPNSMLRDLSASRKAAASWVHDNVTRYSASTSGGGGVRIEYIAVGDEPFLLGHEQQFQPFVISAATNIQFALATAKLSDRMKVVVPCGSDAVQTDAFHPSRASFRPDLNKTMAELLSFLTKHGSPFVLNINPFLSLQQNKNLSLDYVLFQLKSHPVTDGHTKYDNYFDAAVDSLVSSLSKAGFADMDVIVGKVGWPTDGAVNATPATSQTFMAGMVNHLQSKAGTPLRPKRPPVETYLFSLLDEDQRSTATGSYERHWGIFTFDGQAKYYVDVGQGSKSLASAHDVEYLSPKWCVVNNNNELSNVSASFSEACLNSDCTALSPGGSCSGINWPGNISYAFNSYYQQHDQREDSCDFGGLGLITTVDPSVGDCRFAITLRASLSTSIHGTLILWWTAILSVLACVDLLSTFI